MLLAHAPCVRLVPRWRDYSKSYWTVPFRAWHLFVVDTKILRRVRAMLIGSFVRKTKRRLLCNMLLAWHELAVHKTVETRSRSQACRRGQNPGQPAGADEPARDPAPDEPVGGGGVGSSGPRAE